MINYLTKLMYDGSYNNDFQIMYGKLIIIFWYFYEILIILTSVYSLYTVSKFLPGEEILSS